MFTLAEEGAYRRALDNAWKEGSVPADPKACDRVIGNGCTPKIAQKVLEMCFVPMPKNASRMVNLKMEKIRKEQEQKYKNKSTTGKKNIAKRWNKTTSADSNPIPTEYQLDSIKIQTKNKKKEGVREEIPPTPLLENGSRVGVLKQIAPPATELGVWLDAVAVAVGAKDRRSLPKLNRWKDVCASALREERGLERLLEAIHDEQKRIGDQTQFFTPEVVLQKMQMSNSKPAGAKPWSIGLADVELLAPEAREGRFWSARSDGALTLWRPATSNSYTMEAHHCTRGKLFAYSSHLGGMVFMGTDDRLTFADAKGAHLVKKAQPTQDISLLKLSPDGRWAVGGTAEGALLRWDLSNPRSTAYLAASQGKSHVY